MQHCDPPKTRLAALMVHKSNLPPKAQDCAEEELQLELQQDFSEKLLMEAGGHLIDQESSWLCSASKRLNVHRKDLSRSFPE